MKTSLTEEKAIKINKPKNFLGLNHVSLFGLNQPTLLPMREPVLFRTFIMSKFILSFKVVIVFNTSYHYK